MTGAVGFAGTLGSLGEDIEGWGLSLAVEGLAAGESYIQGKLLRLTMGHFLGFQHGCVLKEVLEVVICNNLVWFADRGLKLLARVKERVW